MESDDEDDTFVTIGTPLETFEEDEVPKKTIKVHEQTVKDQQGRQRFHGAFTGGFSAGFYNTVGTLEGWTPSTFTSTRRDKAEQSQQRPEDFMDDEDFSEFGIAPRQVSTSDNFTSTKKKKQATSSGSIIPGDIAAFQDLIIPAKLTVGVKLLRGLGWKEGQGVGPRVKRRAKQKKAKKNELSTSKKIYGCAPPPASSDGEDSSSEEEYVEDITFAPKDTNPMNFKAKDNTHGIGYSGINPAAATGVTSAFSLFDPPAITKTGRKGIHGTAFGVGALEEDDEDIYSRDSMANYDREIGGDDQDQFHGWTAPSERREKKKSKGTRWSSLQDRAMLSHINQVIEGFTLASSSQKPQKVFPPPRVPKWYRPVHHFKPEIIGTPLIVKDTQQPKLDASARAAMLGEVGSVFDLVSRADKEKINSSKSSTPLKHDNLPQPEKMETDSKETDSSEKDKPEGQSQTTSEGRSQPLFKGAMAGFKPFAKDPSKQQRYEKYQDLKKQGRLDEISAMQGHLTEWEKTREKDEFDRASQLYKPMSLIMASRFHRAEDGKDSSELDSGGLKKTLTDAEAAAEKKMYGALTRESYEWHPHNVICKRFNIPNPYPNSTIVGLPVTKQEKFSVFDFLTIPQKAEPPPPPPEVTLASVAAGKNKKTKKPGPLAILNTPSTIKSTPGEVSQESKQPKDQTGEEQIDPTGGELKAEIDPEKVQDTSSAVDSRPPMDLFKAIFDDSNSSSEDEKEEDDENQMKREALIQSSSDTDSDIVKKQSEMAEEQPSQSLVQTNVTPVPKTGPEIQKNVSSPEKSKENSDVQKPIQNKKGGIFSMINAKIRQEKDSVNPEGVTDIQQLEDSGDGPNIKENEQRLPEKEVRSEMFGCQLPHEGTSSTTGKSAAGAKESREKLRQDDRSPSSRESSLHRKHKHKKKEKKSKKSRDREKSRNRNKDGKLKKSTKNKNRSSSDSDDNDSSEESNKHRSRSKDIKERERGKERKESRQSSRDARSRSRSPKWVEAKTEKKQHKKKSKHKHKSKKSKKSKKKKTRLKDKDSDSDSDDDSSDSDSEDNNVPSNSQILQRLMMLKKPK